MRVVHFQRKPRPYEFSVERLFEDVRKALEGDISIDLCINTYASTGLIPRMRDMVAAVARQGDVNHVTGDIHYISICLARERTVLTVLDCTSLERLSGWRKALLWFFWYWLPLRRVRCVTVISEFTKRELLRYVKYDPARIAVIYPPLSEEFTFSDKVLDLDRPRILQVGTTPNKNLLRVVAALVGVPCRLTIIGAVPPEIVDLLKKSGVEWESHVGLSRMQLVDQYRRADVVMFASTYEGFGLPIVEANAIGRPVITGNVCSMPEVAADAACIVDPYDISSIRTGLERLRNDPRYCRKLVEAGRRNAERFRVGKIATQYAEVYEQIARETGKGASGAWPQ